jgi:probable rRNA maturation factor
MELPSTTSIVCESRGYAVSEAKVRTVAELVCASLGVAGQQLAVTFVDSRRIRKLNREFRGKDKATDVLSFPQQEWDEPARVRSSRARRGAAARHAAPPDVLGDVVISLPEAELNAKSIGQPLDREVCFLLVHGILHLCGHDHEEPADEKRMLAAQRALMNFLARQGERPLWTSSVRKRRGPLN